MKMIVGLGNIGAQFDNTPHNVGFAAVDKLVGSLKLFFKKKKKNGLILQTQVEGVDVMFVKPLTYMNNSGDCVYDLVRKFKVPLEDICVVLDDVDLAAGLTRARPNGTAGTHNGLKSVTNRLGTTEFFRIRIGVDAPSRGSDLAEYVLRKMDKKTQELIDVGVEKAVDLIKTFIVSGAVAETK